MLKPATPFTFVSLFACSVLLLATGTAQAQNGAQRASGDEKRCQANTSGASGKANEADFDGTYSACSLVNGFIGFGARTNDGTNQTPEFSLGESDQVLRHPQSPNKDHRLANLLAQQGGSGSEGGLRTGRASGEYRFGTRDFVSVQESQPIDDADGYHGAPRAYAGARSEYAPFVSSSSRETGSPAGGGGGVGGGGVGGGIDGGSNGGSLVPPVTPAVPEPETWAMLMAGLGLLAFAGRRKAGRKA